MKNILKTLVAAALIAMPAIASAQQPRHRYSLAPKLDDTYPARFLPIAWAQIDVIGGTPANLDRKMRPKSLRIREFLTQPRVQLS